MINKKENNQFNISSMSIVVNLTINVKYFFFLNLSYLFFVFVYTVVQSEHYNLFFFRFVRCINFINNYSMNHILFFFLTNKCFGTIYQNGRTYLLFVCVFFSPLIYYFFLVMEEHHNSSFCISKQIKFKKKLSK